MRLLRFADLKARGIVTNWVTLNNWVANNDFPAGIKLGPNTRAWPEEDISDWLARKRGTSVQPTPPATSPALPTAPAVDDSLNTRTSNVLKNMGIWDLSPERISQCSRQHLLQQSNFGKASLKELEDWLARRGHSLQT